MMDNKKIEEAKDSIFNKYFLKNNEGMICVDHISEPVYLDYQVKQAIELGAKWAINEFIKDLFHPAEDIPEENRPVLVVYKHGGYSIVYWEAYNISGQVNYWTLDITQWLYVDELFPKEGGEHD